MPTIKYQNKLSHLSKEDIEDLMCLYYEGIEDELLIDEYNIDIDDSKVLNKTFPLIENPKGFICIHCQTPLSIYSTGKYAYFTELFCEKCDHQILPNTASHCKCDNCIKKKEDIIQIIRDAFQGCTLGKGVGLYQGVGIDDYEDEEELQRLRSNDEHYDWKAIPVNRLNQCYSSLCFFDAAGMRFHLPAFMIAEIMGSNGNANIIFHLTSFITAETKEAKAYSKAQFTALSKQHREAVRLFLLYCLDGEYRCYYDDDNNPHGFNYADIGLALDTFWK